MNGLLTILMLTFFVVMHEAGHYFAARFSKVAVSEFFVGFGPKIFSFKKNGTEYGLGKIELKLRTKLHCSILCILIRGQAKVLRHVPL